MRLTKLSPPPRSVADPPDIAQAPKAASEPEIFRGGPAAKWGFV